MQKFMIAVLIAGVVGAGVSVAVPAAAQTANTDVQAEATVQVDASVIEFRQAKERAANSDTPENKRMLLERSADVIKRRAEQIGDNIQVRVIQDIRARVKNADPNQFGVIAKEIRDRRHERVIENLLKHLENFEARVIETAQKRADRISDFIATAEMDNVAMVQISSLLEDAKSNIDEATRRFNALVDEVKSLNDISRGTMAEVKADVREIRSLVKEAYENFKEIVDLINDDSVNVEAEATTEGNVQVR